MRESGSDDGGTAGVKRGGQSSGMRADRSNGLQRVTGGEGFRDEVEESAVGVAGDDIEGDEQIAGADEVFIVGIEDAEVVLRAVVGGRSDLGETEGGEPGVDFPGGDGNDVEAGLGGDDGHVVAGLDDDAFEGVQAGDELVLEVEPLQVFERGGFPEVEAAGVMRRGDESKLNAGAETEDAIAGDFDDAFFVPEPVVFLTAAFQTRDEILGIQQQTQTLCPFTKVSFLAGDSGRPRCFATCCRNSSEEIERRADKIRSICSAVISGRTGVAWLWAFAFTGHEDRAGEAVGQVGIW